MFPGDSQPGEESEVDELQPFNIETRRRLPELVRVIRNSRRLLILTHDNPDPDSLASAFGLKYLARRHCGNPASVAFGGIVGRAENHALLRECHLNPVPLSDIRWKSYDALALVDHQPRRGMIRWPADIHPSIIIDHHPRRRLTHPVEFVDVRKGLGANASLLFDYLEAAGLRIPRFLATAFICGIRSDTWDLARGAGAQDIRAYLRIFPRADHKKVYRINHPAISPEYMHNFWCGMRAAMFWRDTVTTFAGELVVPDLISEIADRLVKIRRVKWSMVAGYHDGVLFISVRGGDSRRDVGRLIRRVVGRKGSAGGHGFMAGAQITNLPSPAAAEDLFRRFSRRYVELLHPGQPIPDPSPLLETDCGDDPPGDSGRTG